MPPVPFMSMSRPNNNPFLSLFNLSRMSPGPIMIRRLGGPPPPPPAQQQDRRPQHFMGPPAPLQEEMPGAHSAPNGFMQGPIVMKQQVQGPTVIGFSLPNLLNKVGSLLGAPQDRLQPPNPLSFNLNIEKVEPEVEEVVNRVEQLVEDSLPSLEDKLLEIELESDPLEEIFEMEETPRMSSGPSIESFFGRKDDDLEPFHGVANGFLGNFMNKIFNSLPSQGAHLRRLPGGLHHSGGQMTIIKAGPGFREEQVFDIGPNGELREQEHFKEDALSHENPMDTEFDFNDVEVFHTEADEDTVNKSGSVEAMEKMPMEAEKEEEDALLESEPVMDVRMVEEHLVDNELNNAVDEELSKVAAKTAAFEKLVASSPEPEQQHDTLPFLSVLRNSVAENERLSQQLLRQFQELHRARQAWGSDDNSCSSHHMRWSDWVACLHAQTGIPRWLTAATISLGIIFSVWLCLVIPSSAPKHKLKALVIKKAEKPSVSAAKAKEAEASAAAKAKEAEALGLSVSVVSVDMPPTYTPGSPAPSYKSDMAPPSAAVPGSPAPSYRSVDVSVSENQEKSLKLEPEVHGEKKESVA